MPQVTVILPTYNERENIEDLIKSIFRNSPYPTEIVVVDDNSPDGTWKSVKKIQDKRKDVVLLRRIRERGLASAVADGVALSRGSIVLWMDCDFSHPPELMPQLMKALESCDIAVASRFVKGGGMRYSFLRIFASRLVNSFANLLLGFDFKDYTSGYPAVKRRVLQKVRIQPLLGESGRYLAGYGEYFISFLYRARKQGFKLKEVPYTYVPRRVGKTKTSPNLLVFLRNGIVYALTIIYLRLRYS